MLQLRQQAQRIFLDALDGNHFLHLLVLHLNPVIEGVQEAHHDLSPINVARTALGNGLIGLLFHLCLHHVEHEIVYLLLSHSFYLQGVLVLAMVAVAEMHEVLLRPLRAVLPQPIAVQRVDIRLELFFNNYILPYILELRLLFFQISLGEAKLTSGLRIIEVGLGVHHQEGGEILMQLVLLLLFGDAGLGVFEVLAEELMVMMCIFNDDLIIKVYKFPTREAGEVKVSLQRHFQVAILKGVDGLILELILLRRKLTH